MSKGQKAAKYATDAANGGKGFADLSAAMCWDAVVLCAKNAGAIGKKQAGNLASIQTTHFSHFVPQTQSVKDAAVMRSLPEGAFIGFIENGETAKMIHAMICVGKGFAAGNKNSCIGIGKAIGWEVLNLAGDLKWNDGNITVGNRTIGVYWRALPS